MICISRLAIAKGICSLLTTALCASSSFVTDPATLDSNAPVSWSQLGSPGAIIPQSFRAVAAGGVAVSSDLIGGTGTVAQACPASNCNFASGPGINPGDDLIWTENANGSGTGPLLFSFAQPVRGAGFYLELTAPASFTASFIASTTTGVILSEMVDSDSNGDPIFLGLLDPAADILSVTAGVSSCVPNTPGGCDPSDFAADSLLVTAVPEPGQFPMLLLAFAFLLFFRYSRLFRVCLLCLASLFSIAQAQTSPSDQSGGSLPIWNYDLISPINGQHYGGYMVGQNPFHRGARTTSISTVLIPLIVNFHNTTSDFTATFDPTSTPDAGCTAGQTAMSLIENSPIFQSYDWTLNNVHIGLTQYIDAFQRANFWQYVQLTGDSYHTLLTYSEADPLSLSVDYAAPTLSAEVRTGVPGSCTNPSGSGSTNGADFVGFVNMSTINGAVRAYIAEHGITPDQLPIFILYNVVMPSLTETNFYVGGYHGALATFPQIISSPGQTYVVADFQSNRFYTKPTFDVSLLSHEIGEWMNDPGDVNFTPLWGHIGQASGCQGDLEVGDPLTGTNLPTITGPSGFAYHVQELAFFSWFFRTPSTGAGGLFSSNGALTTDAGQVCQP